MLHLKFPRRYTPEQVLGSKFEIWVEELLKDNGYCFVRRNIIYHRDRYEFRQVDIDYREGFLWQTHTMVECKYSSRGKVKLALRETKSKTAQQIKAIDTILDELEERRQFVKADNAILLTNQYFSPEVYREAKQFPHLEVKDSCWLRELEKRRVGLWNGLFRRKSLEQQIAEIDLRRYELRPERVGM
ncbi:MAG: restriction endonuclease [Nanoarchaeota archaeon]